MERITKRRANACSKIMKIDKDIVVKIKRLEKLKKSIYEDRDKKFIEICDELKVNPIDIEIIMKCNTKKKKQ